MAKFIGETGLVYLWAKIKAWVGNYAKITESSGNKSLTVGNTTATLPTKTSQLTNDSDFITSADIPEGAAASSTTPLMDGTAAVGTETTFARGDHRHPTDTTRVAANTAITGATKTKITYDSKGLVTAGADLAASDIPSIPLSKISDVTASAAEVNVLDGITATTAELNYVDGVTSNIQTQLDNKADKVTDGTTGNLVALDANGNIVDAGVSAASAGTDTKNTAGSTNDAAKLFIVGAKSQAANPQTFSQTNAYITAGKVYSNAKEVVNLSDTQTLTNKTLTSPALDGTPTAPTATAGTNTTQVATTSFVQTAVSNAVTNQIGQANGIAGLDSSGKVPSSQLPSYVDDVIEAYPRTGQTELSQNWLATGSASGTAITPEAGKIYVLMAASTNYAQNTEFRWGGTTYVQLNDSGCTEMTTAEMDTATNNWT